MDVICPKCQKRYRVSQEQAGQTARCGSCKATFVLRPQETDAARPEKPPETRTVIPDIAPSARPQAGDSARPDTAEGAAVGEAVAAPEAGAQTTPPGPSQLATAAPAQPRKDAGATPFIGDSKPIHWKSLDQAPEAKPRPVFGPTPEPAEAPKAEAAPDDDKTPVFGSKETPGTREKDKVFRTGEVVLGLYSVTGRIGEGGMGAVYRVHHRGWNADLAVKYPRPTALSSDTARNRFVREAEAWVDLGLHPNVATCFYVREIEGLPCIFMEYVDGGSLLDWVRQDRTKPLEETIDLAVQVCDGMAHAHNRGLIHRDIKPANCLMTKAGIIKITDFGLVKWSSEDAEGLVDILDGEPISRGDISLTTADGLSGTPPYMPPEQWGRLPDEPELPPVGHASDVYAFGVLLFEMLCGRRPFDAPTISLADLRRRHREMVPPDPSLYRPETPFELKRVIAKALEKRPEDRFQRFEDIRKALEDAYQAVAQSPYPRKAPSEAGLVAGDLNNRAISLHDLGRIPEAREALARALAADPSHLESNYNRSLLEWRSGEITDVEVVRRMQEIRNASGFSWRAPYLLALVHLERRDAFQAETVLAEACQTPDVQAQAWIALGNALTGAGKLSQAIEAYRHALGLKGDAREVLTRSAIALYMGGEKRKAEQLLKEPIGADVEAQICLAGGRQRRLAGHTTPIRAVTITRDGRFGASIGQSPDAALRLWDLAKGQCLLDTSKDGVSCTCLGMSACGRFLVSGGADRRLRLHETASAECIWTSESQAADVSFVAFYEAEDKALSVSQSDGTLRVWNTLSGRLIGSQRLAEDIAAFSAAEDVQKAIWTNGRSWFVWDLATGECSRFPVAAQPISALALSRDGQYALIALEETRTIQCWDVAKAALLHEMRGHTGSVLSLDVGPEARTCVSSDTSNTLRLWNPRSGQCILTLNVFAGHAAPLRLDGAGRHCLWGGWDKTLRLWNLGTPWPPAPLLPAEIVSSEVAIHRQNVAEGLVESAKAMLDQRRWHEAAAEVHKARSIGGRERDPELMKLWSLAGQGGRRRALHNGWAFRTFRTDAPVTAVAFTSDSRFVLSGDAGGALVQWDVETGEKAREFRGHASAINAIDACDTRPVALTGAGVARGSDTTARLWDLETGNQVHLLQCIQGPNDVALSLDGRLALIGTGEVLREAPLRLYDLATGRAVRDFEEHTEAVTALDVHPGGCLAVSGFEDGAVVLWDLCSGKSVSVCSEHNEMVTAVAFRPDGAALLSACMSGELRVRALRDSAPAKLLKCSSPVTAALFSPDGQFILAGCQDQTVQLWHAETGQRLRAFEGHTRAVKSVAFSPHGRFAVSGSSDRSIIVWQLDWEYEFPQPVEWHPAATPFLENFLTQQCAPDESGRRQGPPKWSEADVGRFLRDLRHAGLGWVQPEGVRKRLAAMAPGWRPGGGSEK